MSKRNQMKITLKIQGWPWKSSTMMIGVVALVTLAVLGLALLRT